MTNSKKTLVTTLLLTTIAATSAGCAAARRPGLAPKVASAAKNVPLANAAKQVALRQGASLYRGLTPAQANRLRQVGRLIPDNIADEFVVMPRNEATFMNIRGRLPTQAEFRSLNLSVNHTASAGGESQGAAGIREGREEFIAFLDKTQANNVFVIGHNQGGNFYFINGESMPLREMALSLESRGKRGIFLSCKANLCLPKGHPASTTNLTHREALDTQNAVLKILRDESMGGGRQADDLMSASINAKPFGVWDVPGESFDARNERVSGLIQEAIISAEKRAAVKRKVKKAAKVGTGGGIAYSGYKLPGKLHQAYMTALKDVP